MKKGGGPRDQPLRSQPRGGCVSRPHQLVAALAYATPLRKRYRASAEQDPTVRKQVKNDVDICATIHSETVYDVVGGYGQGPEPSRDPHFFLKAQSRRDHHREGICIPISPEC